MADQRDNDSDLEKQEKRDRQVLKQAAVDAAFRNSDNAIIPIDLEDEMKKIVHRLCDECHFRPCFAGRA